MTARQQVSSYAKAVVLVLLLYVLGTFVSGLLVHQGLSATWAEFGFRGVLVAFGVLLFRYSESSRGIVASTPGKADYLFAGGLAVGLITSGTFWALGMAANDLNLRSGDLPSVAFVLTQLILGAAGEELVFVGFLYRRSRESASAMNASLAVGLPFVLLHWPSSMIGVASRIVYILASCALFERCRAIKLNLGLHFLVNGAFFLTALQIEDRVPFASFFADFGLVAWGLASLFVVVASVRYGWASGSRSAWRTTASPTSDRPSLG